MTSVDISGFATGVSASKGTLNITRGTITVAGGTGLEVKDTASATMMGGGRLWGVGRGRGWLWGVRGR
ncbi:hypothetical protein [Bartonella bovis]|uniref:hypothetical protein n=1 Tax=Bartonella bovis TaxID=155194 RepID=UPI0003A74164|nr:hypothetical protein [Bartonella bovis]